MQKTCACGGREFYGLGRYNRSTHQFTLLDATSDLGNNVFDGGEGYAHMNVLDPRQTPADPHGRMLWTGAVIEVRQLRHHLDHFPSAFLSSTPPHTRRVLCST